MERPAHVDPTSPFVLNTVELGRRPGSMREHSATVPAPEDLGTAVIGLPAGTDLDLHARLEAVMEGVYVSGTVSGRAVGECVRCLDEVSQEVEASFAELFVYPGRAAAASEEGAEEDELYELDGDLVDIEPVLRDAVVPALPFSPLCRPDCPGLCPECGVRLADVTDHRHESIDPRWAALGDLAGTVDETKES